MAFDLIIWDCDGCLIDSEMIACQVAAEMWTELGYPVTARQYVERFAGGNQAANIAIIEKETGLSFADVYPYEEKQRRREKAFEEGLKPLPYVREAVEALSVPQCVASGSMPERLYHALKVVGLYERFEGRIFSAEQVEHGKPAPDLFLFAAETMKVQPSRCLVIEDSPAGIMAGKAAGMTVYGYMGGSHVDEAWQERARQAGADLLFDDMRELKGLTGGTTGDL